MTTEIRDEWLVAMKKDGRANAREVKLMAEELIEMRARFNSGEEEGELKDPLNKDEAGKWAMEFRSHLWYHLKVLSPAAPLIFQNQGFIFHVGKRMYRVYRSA